MNASSVRVVQGKDGIPIMVRDEEPFLIDRWRDVETGNEYLQFQGGPSGRDHPEA